MGLPVANLVLGDQATGLCFKPIDKVESQPACFLSFFKNNLFIYFLAMLGLRCCVGFSIVAASGAYPSWQGVGFSWQWLVLLWSMGSGAPKLQ